MQRSPIRPDERLQQHPERPGRRERRVPAINDSCQSSTSGKRGISRHEKIILLPLSPHPINCSTGLVEKREEPEQGSRSLSMSFTLHVCIHESYRVGIMFSMQSCSRCNTTLIQLGVCINAPSRRNKSLNTHTKVCDCVIISCEISRAGGEIVPPDLLFTCSVLLISGYGHLFFPPHRSLLILALNSNALGQYLPE